MAVLCWMVVVVAFSLSIGNSLAVDQNYLTESVKAILDRYNIPNMQFSLAVNIPVDKKKLQDALNEDKPATVKKVVRKGDVYKGTNVVAATFKKNEAKSGKEFTDHAEARVLNNIKPLADSSQGKILILYSFLSPCGDKCTNPKNNFNILQKIKQVSSKAKWADCAFVFSKVFDGYGQFALDDIKAALDNLGSAIGHNNIFRCYYPRNHDVQCIKCYNNGEPLNECVKNLT